MSKNFANLVKINEWAVMLDEILAEAMEAVGNQDLGAKIEAQDNFRHFIKASPSKCRSLDHIAGRAATDVFKSVVDQALAELSDRNDELRLITNTISGVAKEANKDARNIMFEDTIEALNRIKTVLESLRTLEEKLGSADPNLLGKITAVGETIADLASELGDEGNNNGQGGG